MTFKSSAHSSPTYRPLCAQMARLNITENLVLQGENLELLHVHSLQMHVRVRDSVVLHGFCRKPIEHSAIRSIQGQHPPTEAKGTCYRHGQGNAATPRKGPQTQATRAIVVEQRR